MVFSERIGSFAKGGLIGLLAVGLAGCELFPRSGPDDMMIEAKAADSVGNTAHHGPAPIALGYALVDLSADILKRLTYEIPGSLQSSFGGGRGAAPEILVGVGDIVQVTIFESSPGGLFIPAEASVRPGNFVSMPQQTVDKRGYIVVPYAGQILAVGRSLPQIQQDIEARLVNRAIEPQAIVSIVERKANEAAVVGEVNSPGKFAINENGDRVLDIVSRAGGLVNPGYESFVTLQRGSRTATVYFDYLVNNPAENIYVAPGDTIYVYRKQRAFQAFGATGFSGDFKFDDEDLTMAQAVGKVGGFLDTRADPGQVFLYRLETREVVEGLGIDMAKFPEGAQVIPTIYRTNFREPASFFVAQRFPMRDADILYVSNADVVELVKFLDILNAVSSTAAGVSGDILATRDNIRALGD